VPLGRTKRLFAGRLLLRRKGMPTRSPPWSACWPTRKAVTSPAKSSTWTAALPWR